MKKLTLTFAIVLGMTLGALAQSNSSLFQNSYDGDSQSLFEYLQELFVTEEDAEEAFAFENEGGGMFGGGMFLRGATRGDQTLFSRGNGILSLPNIHGSNDDQDTPLGSGIALFLGLGGSYLVTKKRKEK